MYQAFCKSQMWLGYLYNVPGEMQDYQVEHTIYCEGRNVWIGMKNVNSIKCWILLLWKKWEKIKNSSFCKIKKKVEPRLNAASMNITQELQAGVALDSRHHENDNYL